MKLKINPYSNYFFWGTIGIIFIYFTIIFKLVVNIPIADDYMAILRFLVDYSDATTAMEKLKLLFAQHAEHRILFTRLTALFSFWIFGKVNFSFLILVGNFSLVMILFTISRLLDARIEGKQFWIFIIALLLFSFQSQQNSFWAMAALSNYYVISFSVISICCLHKSHNSFLVLFVGIFTAVLAVFSCGNGLVLMFLIIPLIFTLKDRGFKFILIVTILIILLVYFFNFQQVEYNRFEISRLAQPFELIGYFFAFLGSLFTIVPSSQMGNLAPLCVKLVGYAFPIMGGVVLFAYFMWLVYQRYDKKNLVVFLMIFFIIITSMIVSVSRSGIAGAFQSRYKIHSLMLVIFMLISFIELYSKYFRKKWLVLILVFTVGFYGLSLWFNLNRYLKMREIYIAGAKSYYETPDSTSLFLFYYPEGTINTQNVQQAAKSILNRCDSLNIYYLPNNF